MQDKKEQNNNKISNIDGGAAVEAAKTAEIANEITDLTTQLAAAKTESAADLAKLVGEETKAETEKEELVATVTEKEKEVETAKKELDKHKIEQ